MRLEFYPESFNAQDLEAKNPFSLKEKVSAEQTDEVLEVAGAGAT